MGSALGCSPGCHRDPSHPLDPGWFGEHPVSFFCSVFIIIIIFFWVGLTCAFFVAEMSAQVPGRLVFLAVLRCLRAILHCLPAPAVLGNFPLFL